MLQKFSTHDTPIPKFKFILQVQAQTLAAFFQISRTRATLAICWILTAWKTNRASKAMTTTPLTKKTMTRCVQHCEAN